MEERPKAAGAEKVDLQTPKAHVELVEATTDTPVNELSEEEGDDASPEEEGDATSDADMEATTDADHEATTKAKVVTAEGPSQVPVKWMPYSVVPGGLGGPLSMPEESFKHLKEVCSIGWSTSNLPGVFWWINSTNHVKWNPTPTNKQKVCMSTVKAAINTHTISIGNLLFAGSPPVNL